MPVLNSLVSVIMPVYNGEKYLEEAIHSVLCQSYPNIELIIVDDGSSDGTHQVIKKFTKQYTNIYYIYQVNQGPASARNTGICHSQGEIISFLDADDVWATNKLACQLTYLHDNPDVEVVLGLTQFIQSLKISYSEDSSLISDTKYFLNLGSAIFKKSVFTKIGLLDVNLIYSEDIDFFNRIREASILILKHQDIVLKYRQHLSNMTKNQSINNLNILKVMKSSLDRRRRTNNGKANNLDKTLNF